MDAFVAFTAIELHAHYTMPLGSEREQRHKRDERDYLLTSILHAVSLKATLSPERFAHMFQRIGLINLLSLIIIIIIADVLIGDDNNGLVMA